MDDLDLEPLTSDRIVLDDKYLGHSSGGGHLAAATIPFVSGSRTKNYCSLSKYDACVSCFDEQQS